MSAPVVVAAELLRKALAATDPAALSGEDCARVADELAQTEKACVAVRLRAVARAIDAGVHRNRGFSDGPAWLARQSGSTGAAARRDLRTVEGLPSCPDTRAALAAGEISLAQAGEIVAAEAETPGAEAALLPVARTADLSRLRDRARDHRQAEVDPAQLRDRQWAARELRHWQDRDGMVHVAAALPPETGLPLVRKVQAMALRARRAARADGHRERFEAHAADALVALIGDADPRADGPPTAPAARSDLVIVCDIRAYRRGHAHPGEVCHIIGGGPIPVSVAKDLTSDAFVKAVVHDGTRIETVAHFGRHLPATLRTALDLGPVPAFSGRECVDCGSRYGLEYDHVDPVANHGPTSYDNLEARCWKDHQAKTERDRRAGLLGPNPPSPPRRRRSPDRS